MKTFFYPTHPVRCINTASSEYGKNSLLTNLIFYFVNEYDKNTSTHQLYINVFIKNYL